MGIKVDAQKNDSSDYLGTVKEIGQIIIQRSLSILQIYTPLYYFTSTYRKEMKALKILHATTIDIIQKRKEALLSKNNENVDGRKKLAFLDMLLKTSMEDGVLSTEDIREEVDTFMFEASRNLSIKNLFLNEFYGPKFSPYQNSQFSLVLVLLINKRGKN